MSKGEVISATTATVIISATVILLLGAIFGGFGGELKSQGVDKALACKASVAKASQFGKITDSEVSIASCESIVWEVPKLGKDSEENKKLMASFIVKQYEQCWDKFHEGKLNPFTGDRVAIENRCFICSQFTMPQDTSRLDNMDEAISWRFSIDDAANNSLSNAFYVRDNKRYYGVQKIDLKGLFKKAYLDLINAEYEEWISTIEPWDVTLKPGSTYYIYNTFMVEKKDAVIRSFGTHSKIFLGEPSFQPNVCDKLHN